MTKKEKDSIYVLLKSGVAINLKSSLIELNQLIFDNAGVCELTGIVQEKKGDGKFVNHERTIYINVDEIAVFHKIEI